MDIHERAKLLEKQRDTLLRALKSAICTNDALNPEHDYCREWREELGKMRAAVALVALTSVSDDVSNDIEDEQWIEWSGSGQCPVAYDARVELEFRNGSRSGKELDAGFWRWTWGEKPSDFDITAYRVVHEGGDV